MPDEKDMSREMKWFAENIAQRAIKALRRVQFEADYVDNRKEALDKILSLIPPGGTIGTGDSVTLHQIGFFDWLKQQKDHKVFNGFFVNRSKTDTDDSLWAKRFVMYRKALTANVFVTGTNAITLKGELVNMDGNGNRVAGMIFGPNRAIVVSGFNKIVQDVDEAVKKIEQWTAPMNMKRHVDKHDATNIQKFPCFVTGTCQHCNGGACRNLTIIKGWDASVKAPDQYATRVIIVGESLGI